MMIFKITLVFSHLDLQAYQQPIGKSKVKLVFKSSFMEINNLEINANIRC